MKQIASHSWVAAFFALSYCLPQTSSATNVQSLPSLPFVPTCGNPASEHSVNYNSGIKLDTISTLYVFGDSWSANANHTGGTPPPAVAGPYDTTTAGRATNGKMWNEVLLTKSGSRVASFAIGGAVIDRSLYPAFSPSDSDMVTQVQTYFDQDLKINSSSSLTAIYFGINDFGLAKATGKPKEVLRLAAEKYLQLVNKLSQSGMKDFLILTPAIANQTYSETDKRKTLSEFNDIIWKGMLKFQKSDNIRFAHVKIDELWHKITSGPKAFGFVDTKACLVSAATLVGKCKNPDEHPYYLPDHPSAQGHKFIAQYITQVLGKCGQAGQSS